MQKLTLQGAIADANMPEPHLADGDEEWQVVEADVNDDDDAKLNYDGFLEEN